MSHRSNEGNLSSANNFEIEYTNDGIFMLNNDQNTISGFSGISGGRFKKIRVVPLPKLVDVKSKEDLSKRVISQLKWKSDKINYKQVRERLLLCQDNYKKDEDSRISKVISIVETLLLNDVEVHILRDNKSSKILLLAVDNGFQLQRMESEKTTVFKNRISSYKSVVDILPKMQEINRYARITTKGKIYFERNIKNHPQAVEMGLNEVTTVLQKLKEKKKMPDILTDDNLIDRNGPLLFRSNEHEIRIKEGELVFIRSSINKIKQLTKNIFEENDYNRIIYVGTERPEGFVDINLDAMKFDLFNYMEENPVEYWEPVIKIMEKVYGFGNFAQYFQELFNSFMEGILPEQEPIVDYAFLFDRINAINAEEILMSVDEYKRIRVQLCLSYFRMSKVFERQNMSNRPPVPERLFINTDNFKVEDIVVALSYIALKLDEQADPIDYLVSDVTIFSDRLVDEEIKEEFDKIAPDMMQILRVRDITSKKFDGYLRIIENMDKSALQLIDDLTKKATLLHNSVVVLPEDKVLTGKIARYPKYRELGEMSEEEKAYINYEEVEEDREIDRSIVEEEKEIEIEEIEDDEFEWVEGEDGEEIEYEERMKLKNWAENQYNREENSDDKVSKVMEKDGHEKSIPEEITNELDDQSIEQHDEMAIEIKHFRRWAKIEEYVDRYHKSKDEMYETDELLELVDHFINVYSLLKQLRGKIKGVEMEKINKDLFPLADELHEHGLIKQTKVGSDDTDVVLNIKQEGEALLNTTIDEIKEIGNIAEKQKLETYDIDAILENISEIIEYFEKQGVNSYIRTITFWPQILAYVSYQKRRDVDPLLMAITHVINDKLVSDGQKMSKLYFAKYYSKISNLQEDLLSIDEDEENEVELRDVPNVDNENFRKDERTVDPDEGEKEIENEEELMAPIVMGPAPKEKPTGVNIDEEEEVEVEQQYDWSEFEFVEPGDFDFTKAIPAKRLNDDYVLLGKGKDKRGDILEMDIDVLDIPTRGVNILRDEEGLTTVKEFAEYNKAFSVLDGIGEKTNNQLVKVKKRLKNFEKLEEKEVVEILAENGKTYYALKGGNIPESAYEDNYLRRLKPEEVEQMMKAIDKQETPGNVVRSAIYQILTEYVPIEEVMEVDHNKIENMELEEMIVLFNQVQSEFHNFKYNKENLTNERMSFNWAGKYHMDYLEGIDAEEKLQKSKELVEKRLKKLVVKAKFQT